MTEKPKFPEQTMTMSDATKRFIETGVPFKAHHRFPNSRMAGWCVRDKHGYDVCLCDDEDSAHAITDALNASGSTKHPDNQRIHCNQCGSEVTLLMHSQKQPGELG